MLDTIESKVLEFINRLAGRRDKLESIQRKELIITYTVLSLFGAFYLLKFYFVAFSRLDYPFDLEWMEGGAVDHVIRVMNGQALYKEPDADFVPYIYTPLSYYLGAVFSFVFGKGYLALRLLSIVAISGCFWMLFKLCYQETKDKLLSFIIPGLFASTYVVSNNWFDIGRVDSIFLFFVLWAFYKLRKADTTKDLLWTALLLFLAYFTKQSALLLYPFFMILVFNKNWKQGIVFSLVLVGSTVVIMKSISLATGGWFMYYTMTVGEGHELLGNMIKDFWKEDLLSRFHFPSILAILFTTYLMLKPTNKKHLFFILMTISMVAMSYFGRLHSGGDVNVLMPVFAVICLMVGLLLNEVKNNNFKIPLTGLTLIAGVLIAIQLVRMNYNHNDFIPTAADKAKGEEILKLIESVEGPVMVSSHGYWQAKVGKATNAHFMAGFDILRSEETFVNDLVVKDMRKRIANQYYDLIIQDNSYFVAEIREYYVCVDTIRYVDEKHFMPVSGAKLRPKCIYKPKE